MHRHICRKTWAKFIPNSCKYLFIFIAVDILEPTALLFLSEIDDETACLNFERQTWIKFNLPYVFQVLSSSRKAHRDWQRTTWNVKIKSNSAFEFSRNLSQHWIQSKMFRSDVLRDAWKAWMEFWIVNAPSRNCQKESKGNLLDILRKMISDTVRILSFSNGTSAQNKK